MVRATVNGDQHELDPDPDEAAVTVIRDRLGLTGTKLGCGAGVCGACTVEVDGSPVVSCLYPAARLAGRTVRTVEGVGAPGDPHPVQRAFVARDALQCGFCTPGFVMEAVAFHDRWRARHGATEPDDAEIAAALSGHLCRCGAYRGIYAAVREACAGLHDAGPFRGPRVEAADKVIGRARYTVDVQHPAQLTGVVLRSAHAHAVVTSIDLAPALAMDGVSAAVELLGADRTVRYLGQELAAVAAADHGTAERARSAIVVRYDVLESVTDPGSAQAPGAPRLYRGLRKKAPSAAEGPLLPTPWKGNLRGPTSSFSVGRRRARRRIASARAADDPLLIDGVFETAAQIHTALEPHAAVARYVGDRLEVHVSTQAAAHLRGEIADRFGLPAERVRVLAEHVGGGFGAKLGLTSEVVAAVALAGRAQRPVRVVLDRLEELTVGGYRAPARIELSLLTDGAGALRALRVKAVSDSGVAVGSTIAGLARLIYPSDAKELLDYDVVTNLPPATPFRGPGGPLTCWALEQGVDDAAHRLRVDPIDLRRRWDPDPLRQRLYTWAGSLDTWQTRPGTGTGSGRFRRGVGVAAANWFYWYQPRCQVEVGVVGGRLYAASSVQDMGTGSRTVLATAVAEAFGMPAGDVDVRIGDSALVLGPTSGGSRSTATVVPAAHEAVARVQALLAAQVVDRRRLLAVRVTAAGVQHSGGVVSWAEVLADAEPVAVVAGRPDDRRPAPGVPRPFAGGGLAGRMFEQVLRRMVPLRTGHGYTGAVHVSEVEVDTRLGHVRVTKVHAGLAVGRVAALGPAVGQAQGAVVQGIGYALYEQRQTDPSGRVLSVGLEDYRVPGMADVPEIDVHFDPGGFEHVPGGGVGLGEVSTLPVAASIGNAVHNATGWRPHRLPIRPDRLLAGLSEGER